jgi:hypothetical protein
MWVGYTKISIVLLISQSIYLFYTGMFHMPSEMTFQVKVMSEAATTQITLETWFHSTFIAFVSSESTLAWIQFVTVWASVEIFSMFGSSTDCHFTPHNCIPWSSTSIPLQHSNETWNKKYIFIVVQRNIQLV